VDAHKRDPGGNEKHNQPENRHPVSSHLAISLLKSGGSDIGLGHWASVFVLNRVDWKDTVMIRTH
jgi:hypothetical protein